MVSKLSLTVTQNIRCFYSLVPRVASIIMRIAMLLYMLNYFRLRLR